MNITDVNKLETEGIETTAEEKVLVNETHVLIRTDGIIDATPGANIALDDGRALILVKRVARNARAEIYSYKLLQQEDRDHGRPTD